MSSLRERLEAVEVPDTAGARERVWASVAEELAAATPQRRRPLGLSRARIQVAVLGVLAALLAAAVAAGATQPGAAVRSLVVRVLGADRPPAPRARIGPLPAGKLLVTSPRGTWVVARDSSRRLLGSYTGATWSPHGLYVAARSGADLSAIAPDGRVAWRLRTPGPVASAAWSPDGFRVACRRAGGLGIVAGDGTGPRMLAAAVAPAGPAWRPGAPHTLAWVDRGGRVVVRDADTGVLVWRSPGTVVLPRGLAWSADGRLLLVPTAGGLLLADPSANRVRAVRLPTGDRAVAAAWAPRGRRLAVVARRAASDLSRVIVARGGVEIANRPVFETTGRLASPTWSPDGRRVLVRWMEADEWLLVPATPPAGPAAAAPGIVAIAPVAERFGGTPVVRGWCCA